MTNRGERVAAAALARQKAIDDLVDSFYRVPLSQQTVDELRVLLRVDQGPMPLGAPPADQIPIQSQVELARRQARRVPSWKKIAEFWEIDCLECVRCGGRAGGVQKAHIIDRSGDGLDVPWNLAPLCGSCHGGQPAFSSGDESLALAWFGLPSLPNLPGTC